MAFTCNTIVANNEVATSTIVGADTGTVIQDSKPNKDAQVRESEMDYELDISDDSVDRNHIIVNDAILASKAEMEAKIAAIETQHHRATIEHWLAEARLNRDCDFSSLTAMTDLHAKMGNR